MKANTQSGKLKSGKEYFEKANANIKATNEKIKTTLEVLKKAGISKRKTKMQDACTDNIQLFSKLANKCMSSAIQLQLKFVQDFIKEIGEVSANAETPGEYKAMIGEVITKNTTQSIKNMKKISGDFTILSNEMQKNFMKNFMTINTKTYSRAQ